jgi:hypothetical protein
MTIWTKYSEIFNPVIAMITVDMVKLNRYSSVSCHFRPTTKLTLWELYACDKKLCFKLFVSS